MKVRDRRVWLEDQGRCLVCGETTAKGWRYPAGIRAHMDDFCWKRWEEPWEADLLASGCTYIQDAGGTP